MRETITGAARAVPAAFQLVYRLVRDERIDSGRRAALIAALGYAALPFDVIPDRIPIIGKVDDIVLVAAALNALFEEAGDELLGEHWAANDAGLEAFLTLVDTVASLMPRSVRRLLRFET